MIAIKNMAEMPKSCVTYNSENDNYTGCPFYKICKQRETIKTNYKPTDCPLVEVEESKVGKWIRKPIRNDKGGCIGAEMICSYCNKDNRHDEYMDYCPNCGSEMVGAENG